MRTFWLGSKRASLSQMFLGSWSWSAVKLHEFNSLSPSLCSHSMMQLCWRASQCCLVDRKPHLAQLLKVMQCLGAVRCWPVHCRSRQCAVSLLACGCVVAKKMENDTTYRMWRWRWRVWYSQTVTITEVIHKWIAVEMCRFRPQSHCHCHWSVVTPQHTQLVMYQNPAATMFCNVGCVDHNNVGVLFYPIH